MCLLVYPYYFGQVKQSRLLQISLQKYKKVWIYANYFVILQPKNK